MSNNQKPGAGITAQLRLAWERFFLPAQHCFLCRAPSQHQLLCAPCREELPALPTTLCPLCAQPASAGSPCGQCLAQPPAFDRTLALWTYAFPVDTLVHALKYGHQLPLASFLGEALARRSHALPRVDLIMPVPLSPGHLAQRGFNQALEIARPLARSLGLKPDLDSCLRVRDTAPQASLNWKARQKNLRGAFECQRDLSGLHILLVDDVMTSGATLHELARTLKKHGAASVTNLVCARALKH